MKTILVLLMLFMAITSLKSQSVRKSTYSKSDSYIRDKKVFATGMKDFIQYAHRKKVLTSFLNPFQLADIKDIVLKNSIGELKNTNLTLLDSTYIYYWKDNSKEWILFERSFYRTNEIDYTEISADRFDELSHKWQPYNLRAVIYDDQGNKIDDLRKYWDPDGSEWLVGYHDGAMESDDKTEYFYKSWDDSTFQFIDGQRLLTTYNVNNNVANEVEQEWESVSKSWKNLTQYIYDYNTNNLNTSILQKNWDSDKKDWINEINAAYGYNTYGDRTSELYQIWDQLANKWVNSMQYEWTYDETGNKLGGTEKRWIKKDGKWRNSIQYTYSLNDKLKPKEDIEKMWDTISLNWVNDYQGVYKYNENNAKTEFLTQIWDKSKWITQKRETYTYDTNGNQTNLLVEYWNKDTGKLENYYNSAAVYDDTGNILEETDKLFSTKTKEWQITYYNKNDNNGQSIEYYERDWNDSLNVFTYGFKALTTYNTYTYPAEEIILNWDVNNNIWVNSLKYVHYSEKIIGIEPFEEKNQIIQIFPNPTKDVVSVSITPDKKLKTMNIYSLDGKIVQKINLANSPSKFEINISGLNKGVYFINARGNGFNSNKKLIVY